MLLLLQGVELFPGSLCQLEQLPLLFQRHNAARLQVARRPQLHCAGLDGVQGSAVFAKLGWRYAVIAMCRPIGYRRRRCTLLLSTREGVTQCLLYRPQVVEEARQLGGHGA